MVEMSKTRPVSFRDYIKKRRVTDMPAGDFTADAKVDRDLPNVTSWDELEGYLYDRGACDNAIKAARSVWRGYQAAVR
jgi:hypothetical protein